MLLLTTACKSIITPKQKVRKWANLYKSGDFNIKILFCSCSWKVRRTGSPRPIPCFHNNLLSHHHNQRNESSIWCKTGIKIFTFPHSLPSLRHLYVIRLVSMDSRFFCSSIKNDGVEGYVVYEVIWGHTIFWSLTLHHEWERKDTSLSQSPWGCAHNRYHYSIVL